MKNILKIGQIARDFVSSHKYGEEVSFGGRQYRQTCEYEIGVCAALCHNSYRNGSVSDERWKLGYSETMAHLRNRDKSKKC